MSRLLLIRHAKAVLAEPAKDDFARPLTGRGHRDAARLGEYLAVAGTPPDLVLCSSARRTRETLAGLLPELTADCEIRLQRRLYAVEWPDYLAALAGVGTEATTVALIGHNPAVHELALTLASEIAPDGEAIRQRFPTGAMAMIEFPSSDWHDLTPGSGRLTAFVQPRDLHAEPSRPSAG